MSDYKQVVSILKDAQDEIAIILVEPEDQAHALRLKHALDREINAISLITGIGDVTTTTTKKLKPATTIAGEAIVTPKVVTADDLKPTKTKADELKEAVEKVYGEFLTTDSNELLKHDHLVLRGVAKKAGLKVTKDEPKKLTVPFVEEVKKAIEAQLEKKAAKVEEAQKNLDAANEAFAAAYKEFNELGTDASEEDRTAATLKCDAADKAVKEAQAILDQLTGGAQ